MYEDRLSNELQENQEKVSELQVKINDWQKTVNALGEQKQSTIQKLSQ